MAAADEMKDVQAEEGEALSLGPLGDFVGFRFRRIQNQLSREFAAATARHDLRSGLFTALAIVSANPGLSQIALAREIGQDKSITVLIVDDMEKRGLAERRRSPNDRRRHALFITTAGEAFLEELLGSLRTVEGEVLTCLSAAELQLLGNMLDRIYHRCFREVTDVPARKI